MCQQGADRCELSIYKSLITYLDNKLVLRCMKYLHAKLYKSLHILRSNITLRFNKTKIIENTKTDINTPQNSVNRIIYKLQGKWILEQV